MPGLPTLLLPSYLSPALLTPSRASAPQPLHAQLGQPQPLTRTSGTPAWRAPHPSVRAVEQTPAAAKRLATASA